MMFCDKKTTVIAENQPDHRARAACAFKCVHLFLLTVCACLLLSRPGAGFPGQVPVLPLSGR